MSVLDKQRPLLANQAWRTPMTTEAPASSLPRRCAMSAGSGALIVEQVSGEGRGILDERLMRMREVLSIVGVARQTLYQWMARDAFPKPLKLNGSTIAWREREVRDWLHSRPRALNGAISAGACSPSP